LEEAPRSKRVLVIDYSRTGQLRRVMERIVEQLREQAGVEVRVERLRPLPDCPFPWPKPLVVVVACRNMWMLAFEKLKALHEDTGARLVDHVMLTDPGPHWPL
jgi:hypothetical protein